MRGAVGDEPSNDPTGELYPMDHSEVSNHREFLDAKALGILQDPAISLDAKAFFLMLLANASHGIVTEDLPDTHWWTVRDTESLMDELIYHGVYGSQA